MTDQPKVLIADDEQDCIDFVLDALADSPCQVITAMDGEEAWQLIQKEKPQLVILDVQMPKCDGFEVFSRLRAQADLADTPVIMLTGVGERTGVKSSGADMGEFLGSEPDAYIDKPIEPIILKQTVTRLLKNA